MILIKYKWKTDDNRRRITTVICPEYANHFPPTAKLMVEHASFNAKLLIESLIEFMIIIISDIRNVHQICIIHLLERYEIAHLRCQEKYAFILTLRLITDRL